MLAFHNDPALKAKYQARLAAHHAADDIIRGEYGEAGGKSGWRGCAVGCTLHSNNHRNAEAEIGVPEALMQLDDTLFENLPEEDAPQWAVDFLNAIPVGADLSLVASKFMLWVLSDPQFGVRQFADAAGQSVTDTVIALYRRRLAGDEPVKEEWNTGQDHAARAAYNADAAYGTARAAQAALAAYDAAYGTARAAYAACTAAYAAARAATRAATRANAADGAARAAARAAAYTANAADGVACAAARAAAYTANAADGVACAAARAATRANVNAFWQSAKNTLLQLLKDAPVPAGLAN